MRVLLSEVLLSLRVSHITPLRVDHLRWSTCRIIIGRGGFINQDSGRLGEAYLIILHGCRQGGTWASRSSHSQGAQPLA